MSNVVPLRKAAPVPTMPPLAEVRPLPTTGRRPTGQPQPARRNGRPPRRPRNGHHADCPYPDTDPAHCGICRSMTIAADAERTTSRIHPAEETTP